MAIKVITKDNFTAEVLESKDPILVDFWAPWCGYCRRLTPLLDRLADKLGDSMHIATVNVDDNPTLEREYGVDTIPTLFLFKDGQSGPGLVAPGSQSQIEAFIQEQQAR